MFIALMNHAAIVLSSCLAVQATLNNNCFAVLNISHQLKTPHLTRRVVIALPIEKRLTEQPGKKDGLFLRPMRRNKRAFRSRFSHVRANREQK